MTVRIIDTDGRCRPAELIEPTPNGYLHIAAQVDPPRAPGPTRATPKTRDALLLLAPHLSRLSRQPRIVAAQLFRAAGFPPASVLPVPDQRKGAVVSYDLTILIKTEQATDLASVEQDPSYLELLRILHTHGRHIILTPGTNVRRIADVPADNKLHLFNHFLADGLHALELWEHLAGWYQHEMGLTNSEVIAPIAPETTPFACINHASWNLTLAQFTARQLSRQRGFRRFVLTNLHANAVGALPYLYRPIRYHALATTPAR